MAPAKQKTNPRKRPTQARSRGTYDIILKAAERLLVTRGLSALTTNAIAERAGISVGSLYQYFPGKEAILAELVRQMRRDLIADLLEALDSSDSKDLDVTVAQLIHGCLKHHLRNPKLAKELEMVEEQMAMNFESETLKHQLFSIFTHALERCNVSATPTIVEDVIAINYGIAYFAKKDSESDIVEMFPRIRRAVLGYLHFPEKFEPPR